MVKNRELSKIEEILDDNFVALDQQKINETNIDKKGNTFYMKRDVVGDKNIDYKIYRFDPEKGKLFPYFKEVSGLKKVCDYFIFAEDNRRFFIFLIELKKHNGSPFKQLNISESFGQFILSRAEKINMKIEKDINFRKLGIKDSHVALKKTTKYYTEMSYDKNEYTLIQSGKTIRLLELMDLPIDNSIDLINK